ncbi:YqaA family protein [Marinifilum caeruleilacunae]|jgi:membrane protein YqaA with SNARE-associated domain|uniref:Short-chain dehydrogenase n=1 Tax=Marinifilum caeruleilacunae TaxID=2499076 RepID=A0ABX1WQ99_9BACT|nr:VTT domain-containing protein [Marinifilum caeruleilacunae]NOU58177.1 short-chain dehydrogenase [Marinifilum caeruleilacunae]
MKLQPSKKSKKPRILLLHQYYSYTGFYNFIVSNLKKAIVPLLLIGGLVFFLEYYVLDFENLFYTTTKDLPTFGLLTVFFISESFLGLIPPELFIAWVKTLPSPLVYLTILAILSYLGGCVSYFIGRLVVRIPRLKKWIEVKIGKHIQNIRKWGGFLIIVGALLPIPFSIVSIASGIIHFSFRKYLFYGLFRFLRFYLFALAIFRLME